VFLGDSLGGRPQGSYLYGPDGRVDYEKVRRTPLFRKGLERLAQGLEHYTVAMLCAEDDPLNCHRGLMIGPALREFGIAPLHLHRNGSVEVTGQMEERLLAEMGILSAPLLTDHERQEMLAEAYRRRASRNAYQVPREGAGASIRFPP
jgi:hypothetical protein